MATSSASSIIEDQVKPPQVSAATEAETQKCIEERVPKLINYWKFLDFEHYKNRYGPTEGLEIIEVLRGYPNLAQDIWDEDQDLLATIPDSDAPKEPKRRRRPLRLHLKNVGPDYMQRIRIQSPALILILSRLTGNHETWAMSPNRTFSRPFRTQYYFLSRMKEVLVTLEKRFGEDLPNCNDSAANKLEDEPNSRHVDCEDDTASVDSDGQEDIPIDEIIRGDVAGTLTALQHVKTYVKFVETHVVPIWDLAQGTTKRKVTFSDLWASFQPGEILFHSPKRGILTGKAPTQPFTLAQPVPIRPPGVPPGPPVVQESFNVQQQSAWRLYSVYRDSIPGEEDMLSYGASHAAPRSRLVLSCYHIDYDGRAYIPVSKVFTIWSFDGVKDITHLDIYPLRFAQDPAKLMQDFSRHGKQFLKYATKGHLFYKGWALVKYTRTGRLEQMESEFVDSDVMVDFDEGSTVYPSPKPLISLTVGWSSPFVDGEWPEGQDETWAIRHWGSADNRASREEKPDFVMLETMQSVEVLYNYFMRDHLKDKSSDKFMHDYRKGLETTPTGDDLALFPRQIVAYAFRERRFILADCDYLREVREQGDVFEDLEIDNHHKKMILSLVEAHFNKQNIQRNFRSVDLNQDIIRGKGSGLVIMLHGVPGVGKTATAEAIAQRFSKPLFAIACGDLGYEPYQLDAALKELFHLAQLWDCVLLLDEADVFLSRRDIHDLKRNALVSVFLRVLEYYSGILFLTTNRVGHLDEAFRSRIHISLYYPPLDRDQTVAIFKINIKKLSQIEDEKQELMDKDREGPRLEPRPKMEIDEKRIIEFAGRHWDKHARRDAYQDSESERWNGRQIRNAFQIAYSLAQRPSERPDTNKQDRILLPSQHLPPSDSQDGPVEVTGEVPAQQSTPLKLNHTHFLEVAKVIRRFDEYLSRTLAGTSADNAREEKFRDDDYVLDPTSSSRPNLSAHASAPGHGQSHNRFERRPTHSSRDLGRGPSTRLPLRNEQSTGSRGPPTPVRSPGVSVQRGQRSSKLRRGGLPALHIQGGRGISNSRQRQASEWQADDDAEEESYDWDFDQRTGVVDGGDDSYGYPKDSRRDSDYAFGASEYDEHDDGEVMDGHGKYLDQQEMVGEDFGGY